MALSNHCLLKPLGPAYVKVIARFSQICSVSPCAIRLADTRVPDGIIAFLNKGPHTPLISLTRILNKVGLGRLFQTILLRKRLSTASLKLPSSASIGVALPSPGSLIPKKYSPAVMCMSFICNTEIDEAAPPMSGDQCIAFVNTGPHKPF